MASLRFIHTSACKDDCFQSHLQFLQTKKKLPLQRKFRHNPSLQFPFLDLAFSKIIATTSSRCNRITCSARGVSSVEREVGKMGSQRGGRSGKALLRVRLDHQVEFGEHVAILGSCKELGSWKKKVAMTWTAEGWVSDLELKGGSEVEYKFAIVKKDKKMAWEEGGNRVLKLPKEGDFGLVCHWNRTGEDVKLLGLDSSVGERDDVGNGSAVAEVVAPVVAEGGPSPFVQEWQGTAASFMRSNEHGNRDSERRWNMEGLEGLSLKLVESDRSARNWWRKIQVSLPSRRSRRRGL